jgi:topoisomerase IV subunit A
MIEKFDPERVYTIVYLESATKQYYVKRFRAEVTEKRVDFIESPDKLILITSAPSPGLEIQYDMKLKTKGAEREEIPVKDFIGVKGCKAKGKRITVHALKKINWMETVAPPPFRIDAVDDLEIVENQLRDEVLPAHGRLIPDDWIPLIEPAQKKKNESPHVSPKEPGEAGQMELPL